MSIFALVPSDNAAASATAASVAADVRTADGTGAMGKLAAALPGSTTAEVAPQLGDAWKAGIEAWSTSVESFSADIDAATADATTTDAGSGSFFDRLLGSLGGPGVTTYGDLRSWDGAGLTEASADLRADLKVLEKARDELELKALPDSWVGLTRLMAEWRRDVLVARMSTHIEELRTFEHAIYQAHGEVDAISRIVADIDHDATAHDFLIRNDGAIVDNAEARTFESATAADAYVRQRTALMQSLADRVSSVLDQADEVDAALLHARPQESFSEDGPQGVVDPEVEGLWGEMSDEERRETLEEIAEQLAEQYGIEDFGVRILDLEDEDGDGRDDDPTTDSRGSWNEGDRELNIDVNDLDDPDILNTVAHEVRHAAQHKYVDEQFPGLGDRILGGLGLKDDPPDLPPGISRDEVEDWRDNFDDYKTSEDDGFDAYYNQPVEEDAREAGEDFLDGLTGEDLERYREEAG